MGGLCPRLPAWSKANAGNTENGIKKGRILSNSTLFGGDKRDRTADLLNAMAV